MASNQPSEIQFSILKHYGVLSTESSNWTKELNLVSWNNREAKYDIRSWAPDKKKMGRGITLNGEECALLRTLLNTKFSNGQSAAPAVSSTTSAS
ncbi:MAG: PC4/YdbC family ssDNA-binding protein [Sporolactobacillus sp.]